MILVCVALRLLGHDPIFRQSRIGHGGVVFSIYKYRTIPEKGWETPGESAFQALRTTAFRRISLVMRATGVDELPQLMNIARGEMRFIGPRPLTPADFEALPEMRMLRCTTWPGVTGLAQVNGGADLDPVSKLLLDLYFIEHATLKLRVEIVIRSIGRLLGLTLLVRTPSEPLIERAKCQISLVVDNPDPVPAANAIEAPGGRRRSDSVGAELAAFAGSS
jgi:lipopolysaccharide/colanic/teichoic acid biosynthesis glycosyltransferase